MRLAIVVRDVSCRKKSDMHGGRFFKYSALVILVSYSAGLSQASSSVFESRLAALLLKGTRSRLSDAARPAALIVCATSCFWKSLSSNGTGKGVVQELSIMQDGRPVMTVRRCSTVYNDHQTRYRISLELSEVQDPRFRRCRPRASDPRTALPHSFQALGRQC